MTRSALEAILLILSYETLKRLPYQDGTGHLTIGWGHKILPGETDLRREISRERANSLFVSDLERHERGALEALGSKGASLSPLQVGAIVSLTFNIGVDAFGGTVSGKPSGVARAIREGRLTDVPAAIKLWNKGRVNGVLQVMGGLVERRESEARLWIKGS